MTMICVCVRIDFGRWHRSFRIEAQCRRPHILTAVHDPRVGVAPLQLPAHHRLCVSAQKHSLRNNQFSVVAVVRHDQSEIGMNTLCKALDTVVWYDMAQRIRVAERLYDCVGDVVFRPARGEHLSGSGLDLLHGLDVRRRCGHGGGNQANENYDGGTHGGFG